MKTFLITRTGTTESTPIRATSKAEAMVKYVDTYWSSWYFSATGESTFELYSIDGAKISFIVG